MTCIVPCGTRKDVLQSQTSNELLAPRQCELVSSQHGAVVATGSITQRDGVQA